jgi:hypothetical protein
MGGVRAKSDPGWCASSRGVRGSIAQTIAQPIAQSIDQPSIAFLAPLALTVSACCVHPIASAAWSMLV